MDYSVTSSLRVKGSSAFTSSSCLAGSSTFSNISSASAAAIFLTSGIFLVLLDGKIAIPLLEICPL